MVISEADLALARKKKLTAGLCGVLSGGFAFHKFVLGYSGTALLQMLISATLFWAAVTIGMRQGYSFNDTFFVASLVAGAIGTIEGVIYLTKPEAAFFETYLHGQKHWF